MEDQGTLGAVMTFIICAVLYFLPTMNAKSRKHPSRGGIFALNLFLGWTFIGWVAALVWSASSITQDRIGSMGGVAGKAEELEKLAALKERGHITDAEFEKEKSRLLR